MPPKLPKLVPWHSPAEFIQVYGWFYPPLTENGATDIRAQECALRRLKAWESRGKLPHAIDSTAALVSVRVRDWSQTCSDQELRLMYSMVFIRFVNGYVDAFQTSNTAKSIAYLAVEKVGMPAWFVELRHTATHDYLPSLTILRGAAEQALSWINVNYWIPQLESIRQDEALSPEALLIMSDDVRHMIKNYRDEKERQIEDNVIQPKQDALVISRLVRDLIKRCRSGDDLLEVLIPILLEPGMLVPNSKKMRSSSRDLSLDNLGRMVGVGWMPLMNRLYLDLRSTTSVKDGEPLSFWSSLMNAMLDKLIEANLASQAAALPTATEEQKAAAKTGSYLITTLAWMKYIIKIHYEQSGSFKGRMSSTKGSSSSSASPSSTPRLSVAAMASQLVAENAANQAPPMFENDEVINIVEDCLHNILSHFSPLIRSVLNTVIEYDAEVKEKIGPILKQIDQRIASGGAVAVSIAPSEPASVEASEDTDMEATAVDEDRSAGLDSESSQHQDGTSTQQGSWTLYDEESWRPCPIGCLPGGIVPDLSLPWDLDRPPIARIMI
ncbi:Las1-like-domain-containing protein [Mortierella sp. GBAus27b]|nr:Las1-like-domain-containing protein [Mortierella sp. GBAus27b]